MRSLKLYRRPKFSHRNTLVFTCNEFGFDSKANLKEFKDDKNIINKRKKYLIKIIINNAIGNN